MKSKLLIEKQSAKLWRLVERELSEHGFKKVFYPIEVNLPSYFAARKTYELTKMVLK